MMDRKCHPIVDRLGNITAHCIFCRGCGYGHSFDDRWSFNGDLNSPTFGPNEKNHGHCSHLIEHQDNPKGNPTLRCHCTVTNGKISFGDDCEHHLRNQTVELEIF